MSAFEVVGPAGSGGGIFDAYAMMRQVEAEATPSGASVSATWNKRTLNEIVEDAAGLIISLSSSAWDMAAAKYRVRASAPANIAGTGLLEHRLRLQNTDDATTVADGQNAFAFNGTQGIAVMDDVFTLAATKTLELQHYTSTGRGVSGLDSGMGRAMDITGFSEYYAVIEFWRFAA